MQKASDQEILSAYKSAGSVWKAAKKLGMCGQSVHERMQKIGATKPPRFFTEEEKQKLVRDYVSYGDAGKLGKLAKEMGRTLPFISRQAGRLGLTNKRRIKRYFGPWKYMDEKEASVLFDRFKKSKLGLGRFCALHKYGAENFSEAMRRFFPDEYDALIESKFPRQTWYRIGRAFEYRVRDELRRKKYFVLRSPASKSPLDLVAIKTGRILFIQCKRGGALGVKEWNELFDVAVSVSAIPILAENPLPRCWRFWRLTARKDGSRGSQPRENFEP